jgi:HD-like signal output (HDOD) protein
MAAKAALRKKIERITNLPTLPEIVVRILRIINDPETSTKEIARAVSQDPPLSAKILRLANSAFYGMPRSITSINKAVVLLGTKVIRTIVLSLTVFDMFPGDNRFSLFNRTAFWRHSTSCAFLCRFLAEELEGVFPFYAEEAFCGGLLHDLGKVVMEQYLHEDFHLALRYGKAKKIPLYNAELEILDYAHTDVAQWLTSSWDLPDSIQLPMVFHHTPSKASQCKNFVALVHFADYLCYKLKLSISVDFIGPMLDEASVKDLSISDEHVEKVAASLAKELDNINLFCEIVTST